MEQELLMERLSLVVERIGEISQEKWEKSSEEITNVSALQDYFGVVAKFLLQIEQTRLFLQEGGLQKASLEELLAQNHSLYEDIMPENYETSYANPAYAVYRLGEEFGAILSFLYTEMRSLIGFTFEGRLFELVIRMELFVEIYGVFWGEWQENKMLPKQANIKQIIYWFVSDYADISEELRIKGLVVPGENFAENIIRNCDLSDPRYLFAYGEYVGENELTMAKFMAELPEETIHTMADTYTEGYRMGFVLGNKDLSKKKTVDLRYQLGFERMMKRALENFDKMNLQPVIFRAAYSILYNPSLFKCGYYGGIPNRQYEFDHKDDRALFLDKTYVNRKLEVIHTAFEKYKEEARGYAGPAVVETFGEKDFNPVNKKESLSLSDEQSRLWVEYRTKVGELQRNYILEEERSFTIIAFPVPEIADALKNGDYDEFFKEIIRINTLDYTLYRDIQQNIIDVLDTAKYCEIKGKGENRTELKVQLCTLNNPEMETIFENCVADVNIPVGEVFTSPVLKGTNGILHVTRVYLNELEYKNLAITFEDGMIKDYSCDNFATEEENRTFIKENVLFRHNTLPLGEFAIGTNTTAYVVAKKYGVEDKFPILIAEKMGPHFAVGDTCYSHSEEVKVYNPDGKEIVAKDNEVSRLRDTKPSEAYFNCHTDITIPYDELGELTAVKSDGTIIPIIADGRFVLPGTEALNRAFE